MTSNGKHVGTKFDDGSLTPIQVKLMAALDGGKSCPNEVLRKMIDQDCTMANLYCHMSLLRTKMRQRGECTILCEEGGYRKVSYEAVG